MGNSIRLLCVKEVRWRKESFAFTVEFMSEQCLKLSLLHH